MLEYIFSVLIMLVIGIAIGFIGGAIVMFIFGLIIDIADSITGRNK